MSDEVWKRQEIASPCVKLCVVQEESGLCTGCLRSLDEIREWSKMSDAQRRAIMDALPARKPLLSKRRGGRKGRLAKRNKLES
ncbi:MAG: DUF1289 domain-containing protein [Rhodobacterales bacterium]|nr:MAG: DUF1289 domain-containing protein [Rhodobacterales bacterium]